MTLGGIILFLICVHIIALCVTARDIHRVVDYLTNPNETEFNLIKQWQKQNAES